MTTTTQTLDEFLLARIAEDEEAAQAAAKVKRQNIYDPGFVKHAARTTPARTLAECEAKRQIVEENRDYLNLWSADFGEAPTYTLRHLAAVYADHPDYRDEWRA